MFVCIGEEREKKKETICQVSSLWTSDSFFNTYQVQFYSSYCIIHRCKFLIIDFVINIMNFNSIYIKVAATPNFFFI